MNSSIDDDRWRWGKLLMACFDHLQPILARRDPPVLDREIIPDFVGGPDGLSIWLICSNSNEVSRLSLQHDELRTLFADAMSSHGFPKLACESLRVLFTSHEDIEAGGGRFYFFR
jgi:hypothetical protein